MDHINFQNIQLVSPFEGDNEKIKAYSTHNRVTLKGGEQWYLKNGVYWVRGAVNSVIHDFNLNVLYWLNYDSTQFLHKVLHSDNLTEQFNEYIIKFIKAGVITSNVSDCSSENIEHLLANKEKIKSCYIELTQKCNLKCKHCYNASDDNLKLSMTLDDFIKIVDQVSEYGIEKLQLIGGEPLLVNRTILFKLLDYASPRFKSIKIYTNGTLIDNEFAEKVSRYRNVKFSLSLYSFIETEHDKFTGVRGSHKKTLNAIRYLKVNNIETLYAGIAADELEIGDNPELANDFSLDYVRLVGRGSLKLYNRELLRKRLKTLDSLNYEWTKENIINLHHSRCFSRILYISCNQDVFPCAMERRLKHGNLKEDNLSNIIQDNILNYSKKDINGCKDCEFRYICFVCPPDSLSGKLGDKPWNCTYDVYNGKWLNIENYINKILKDDDTNQSSVLHVGGCRTGVF